VVELIGALDEIRVVGVDGELDLTDVSFEEANVDEQIVRTLLQPIFNPYYFECVRVFLAKFQ